MNFCSSRSRRRFLQSAAGATVVGSAGCLGEEFSCSEFATVLDRSLEATEVRVPFEQYGEAADVIPEFEKRGYTASIRTELEVPGEPDTAIIEILGQINESLVKKIAKESGVRIKSIEQSTVGDSTFTDINGVLKGPWETPVLKRRVNEALSLSEKTEFEIPKIYATKTSVAIGKKKERIRDTSITRIREALYPSGRFVARFRKPGWDDNKANGYRFYSRAGDADFIDTVSLTRNEGSLVIKAKPRENLYIKAMFDPGRAARLPDMIGKGYIEFLLDGQTLRKRKLTALEKRYFRFYKKNIMDEPDGFDPVPIIIDGLSARDAVVLGSSLVAPTGSPNVFSVRCRSEV
jgi:hypothetical protein